MGKKEVTPVVPSLPSGPECERCGRCLSVCPSYRGYLQETMSPRGRWELVHAAAKGELTLGKRGAQSFSRCLQCMACKEACPKGVDVPAAVMSGRGAMSVTPTLRNTVERKALEFCIPHRQGMADLLRMATPLRRLLPRKLSGSRHLPLFLPDILAGRRVPRMAKESIFGLAPSAYAAAATPFRGEVVLFTGCFFGLVDPAPAQAAIHALTANGFAVRIPHTQGCCGAPAYYGGHLDLAIKAFERNLDALLIEPGLPVLTLCATCGNVLQNVGHKLIEKAGAKAADLTERIMRLGERVQDCCDFLAQQPTLKEGRKRTTRVTVHDPCHLIRGMHVSDSVRTMLSAVPGLDIVEADSSVVCCGGGGLSGFKHPEQADRIGAARVQALVATRAQAVVAPCPGCLLQLRDQLSRKEERMRALHPIELLAKSYC